jgi:hypothetical protein
VWSSRSSNRGGGDSKRLLFTTRDLGGKEIVLPRSTAAQGNCNVPEVPLPTEGDVPIIL